MKSYNVKIILNYEKVLDAKDKIDAMVLMDEIALDKASYYIEEVVRCDNCYDGYYNGDGICDICDHENKNN